MPRYVSPGRTPSPSRSPSRGRTYTDGVYTPTSPVASRSPSPRRSRSRRSTTTRRSSRGRPARAPSSDSYYSYSDSDSRSRSRSTAHTKQSTKSRLASALDTSGSTGKEKAENVLKTSLVMLGAIGAASLAAHKFWPKGITYGEKDDWETEHEKKEHEKKDKVKGKMKEGRDEIEGKESGEPDPVRKRYIEERYRQRPRLPPAMGGDDGAQFWEKRDRVAPPRQRYIAAYADPREDERDYGPPPPRRRIEAPPPPPPVVYGDPAEGERGGDYPPPPRQRIAAAAAAAAPLAERDDETNRAEPARSRAGDPPDSETRRAWPARSRIDAPRPPPPAPAPPRSFADSAPLVVPAGASRASSSGRDTSGNRAPRYYVDGDTIVVPSSGERSYVIQRDAPPGQRLRQREIERSDDRGYYR